MLTFLLRALNGRHDNLVAEHLGHFLAHDLQRFDSTEHGLLLNVIQGNPDLFFVAVDSFCDTLRTMADMWIASGKDPSDSSVDAPATRNVEDLQPGFEFPLFGRIDRLLLHRYPRYTGMRRDGTIEIKDTFPRLDTTSPSFRFRQWQSVLQDFGQMWAAHDFSRLLDSPYSRRVSRCDRCKCYFAYDRNRLRTVNHGVFCQGQDCKGKASNNRTKRSRGKRLDTAAKAWIEWQSKRRKGQPDPGWITERVNKAHGTAFGRRWISQNLIKIQERMEALQHATRKNQES